MPEAIKSEVREEIVEKIKNGELKQKEASDRYGIKANTISTWVERYLKPQTVSMNEYRKLGQENRILRELVSELTIEVKKIQKRKLQQ